MEYELTAKTANSILRFRDSADPESAKTFVDFLTGLAGDRGGVVIDVDTPARPDMPALLFIRDVQQRLRGLQAPIWFQASDAATRSAIEGAAGNAHRLPDEDGVPRLRLSMTLH